jgi:hypothetical protein
MAASGDCSTNGHNGGAQLWRLVVPAGSFEPYTSLP